MKVMIKRACAIFMVAALMIGMLQIAPNKMANVQASGGAANVETFATTDDLMTQFDLDGTDDTVGKIAFGKKSDGTTMEWYIAGADAGINSSNVVLYAASLIRPAGALTSENANVRNYAYEAGTGYGDSAGTIQVYANHYGASVLRKELQAMAVSTDYFSETEQALMNATTVTTKDLKNNVNYTTTDKVYLAMAQGSNNATYNKIYAGSDNGNVIHLNNWVKGWNWVRSAATERTDMMHVTAKPDYNFTKPGVVNVTGGGIVPVINLDLSNVLFASAANADATGIIADGTAMKLRFNGSTVLQGTSIKYNAGRINYTAPAGTTLMVQGKGYVDGVESDWSYRLPITSNVQGEVLTAEAIKTALDLDDALTLAGCEVWVEKTSDNGLIYAVRGEKNISLSVETFASTVELMSLFETDGSKDTVGKIFFGKDSEGNVMEWYIVGTDAGVNGDNIILYATSKIRPSAIMTNENANARNYTYEAGTGYGDSAGTIQVYANHYGASVLRKELQTIASNTQYFSLAEQALMNNTTFTTKDLKNNKNYTITDKLYLPMAEGSNNAIYNKIYLGSDNSNVVRVTYWEKTGWNWLRSADTIRSDMLHCAVNQKVNNGVYTFAKPGVVNATGGGIVPAVNINLSNVLFASAAKTNVTGVIADGTAMTLRFNGDTVLNDASAKYDENTIWYTAPTGNAIMVQGRGLVGGVEKDWVYSLQLTSNANNANLTTTTIQTALGLDAAPSLNNCEVWVEEIGNDGLTYAKEATITIVDKTALNNLIADVEALNEADYISTSWDLLEDKLEDAKNVSNSTASSQVEVDAAETALRNAKNALLKIADKTALNTLIAEVEALNKDDYISTTWNALKEALEDAKEVANKAVATQVEADAAETTLKNAKNALVKVADKTALNKLIAEVEALNKDDYTSTTWNALKEVLDDAKEVANKADVTQGEADVAETALKNAKNALVKVADKTALNKLIAEVEVLKADDYVNTSWSALQAALSNAKEVTNKVDAIQTDVDEALNILKNVKEALELKTDNVGGNTAGTGGTTDNAGVQTGDNANIVMLIILLAASIGAMLFVFAKKRIVQR